MGSQTVAEERTDRQNRRPKLWIIDFMVLNLLQSQLNLRYKI